MSENPTPSRASNARRAVSARTQFRQRRQRRQNFAFSLIVGFMAITSLLAMLVLSGLLTLPGASDFTESTIEAEAGDVVCPPENATPTSLEGVRVKVLNATGRPGLAGAIGERLAKYGAAPEEPANFVGQFYGTTRLSAGKGHIEEAYTIARLFPDSSVRYDEASTDLITIVIGEHFSEMPEEAETDEIMENQDPLVAPENCSDIPQ